MHGTKGSQSENIGNRAAKQNKTAGEGLGLVRETKGSQSENKGNRGAKQNKTSGEGLGLVRETKGSQSENKGNRGAKQNKTAGEGLGLVRETKGSQSENKGNRGAKQNKTAGEILGLVHGTSSSTRERKEVSWNTRDCRQEYKRNLVVCKSSLLKTILESRLFVGRNRLGDCHLQENTMGIFWEETVNDFMEAAQWASYCMLLRRLKSWFKMDWRAWVGTRTIMLRKARQKENRCRFAKEKVSIEKHILCGREAYKKKLAVL